MWLSPTAQAIAPRLLAPGEPLRAEELARLTDEDWDTLTERFEEHRVAALAHWSAQARGDIRHLPDRVEAAWGADRAAHTIRSLHLQQRLVELATLFADERLDAVALKGAYLAFFAYPEPALRPMRDLDFAFPDKGQAVAAWELLRRREYSLYQPFDGNPLALLDEKHQLPTLISPDGVVAIEVQHRLFHHGRRDPAFEPTFWSETQEKVLLDTAIRFPDPNWLALHIVVHGVRDHRFDSGPNVIADIAMLDRVGVLDGERVGTLMDDWDAREEWSLVRSLVDAHWKTPTTNDEDRDTIDAWTLMLAPPADVIRAGQRARAMGGSNARVWRKLFPNRALLEGRYGTTNRLGLLRHAGRHYAHLVRHRLPALLQTTEPAVDGAMRRLDARLRGR